MRNYKGAIAGIATGLMLLTACGGGGEAKTTGGGSSEVTMAVGQPTTFEFIPAELGLQLGVWEKRGLDVTNLQVQGSGEVAQAIAAGEADLGLATASATIGSIVQGVPQKVVAGIGDNDFKTMVVIVPTDSAIKTVADLKGKTLGVTSPGSGTDYLAKVLQQKQGWSDGDIKRAAIGGFDEQLAAMESGSTDGFIWSIEAAYTLEESGEGRILTDFGFLEDEVFMVMNGADEAIENKPEAVQEYVDGWFETVEFMQDNPDETISFIKDEFKVSGSVAKNIYDFGMEIMSRDGTIPQNVLDGLTQSVVAQGIADEPPAAETWWDDQFVPANVG